MKQLLEDFAERKFLPHRTATGGIITIKDSNWLLSVTVNRQPQFKNQPEDVTVAWAYALFPDNKGDFIDKKMSECSGRELLQELLYHFGIDEKDMKAYEDECIVIPAMMRRFHEATQADANEVVVWGTGKPMREFLHVDDMATACLHVVQLDSDTYEANTQPMLSHINVGTGIDCTIRELAETMAKVTGFKGHIKFDSSKPDGTPRKLMDVSRLKALGWESTISLEDGLKSTYQWFIENETIVRK